MPVLTCFDLESTGSEVDKDRIIELAVICEDLDSGKEIIRYARRFNPGMHIPAKVVGIHGIADADVVGAPEFKTAAPLIGKLFEKTGVLIGHNSEGFDNLLVIHEFLRSGVTVNPFPASFDTMLNGRWATPDGKYPTLGELCWALDVPYDPEQAHGALYDVSRCLSCFRRAVKLGLWKLPEAS